MAIVVIRLEIVSFMRVLPIPINAIGIDISIEKQLHIENIVHNEASFHRFLSTVVCTFCTTSQRALKATSIFPTVAKDEFDNNISSVTCHKL